MPIDLIFDGLHYSSSEIVDITTDNPEAYIAIEINSNAFSPIFCKNDRVLIADRFPVNGEKIVFLFDSNVYLRTYIEHDDRYTMKSINKHGQDFEFKRLDKIKCIGTCVGVIRA